MSGPERAPRSGLPRELERLLHDLRGPLNSVFMHLEVLKHAGDDPAARGRSLEVMERELGRLARMLPAAFDVLALECGALAPVDLREVAEEALRAEGPAPVALDDGAWPTIHADRALVLLALRHLVRNALEATGAGGSARPPRLSVEAGPGTVTVLVRDHGPGLKSTNPRAVIRLSPPHKAGGVCLGLLTADRVARLHGGELTFAPADDGGTEVRLVLATGPVDQMGDSERI